MRIELDRLWTAALRSYAGHFGDVEPIKVLSWLLHKASDELKKAVKVCMEAKLPVADAITELHDQLGAEPKNEYTEALKAWPTPLWKAVREAVKHRDTIEGTAGLTAPLGLDPLFALEVASTYDHWSPELYKNKSAAFQRITFLSGIVDLVLRHLPAHYEKYARNLSYVLVLDPKLYPLTLDTKERVKLKRIGNRFKLPRLGVLKNPSSYKEKGNASWHSGERAIYLTNSAKEDSVAHEIGHAIWELAYDSDWLYSFLTASLKNVADHEKSVDDFAASVQLALQGTHLDWAEGRTERRNEMLSTVKKMWGEEYVKRNSQDANALYRGGPMVQLRMLLKKPNKAHKLVKELILDDEANQFLVAWDEHWAEGFVSVLLHREPMMPIPGVIISLIQKLLRL